MRIQGRTIFAAGLALVLLPVTGAEAAAQKPSKPALATGVDREAKVSFRLEGRTLTVRAPEGLGGTAYQARLRLLVRCGESVVAPAQTSAATLAVQGGRQVRSTTQRTVLRTTLSRDVAARANWCELRDQAGREVVHSATMRLRRGRAPGCAPAGREKVVFREGIALVTGLSAEIDGESDHYLRVCMRARDVLEPLAAVSSRTADNATIGGMVSRGGWLASISSSRNRYDHAAVSISVLDVTSRGPVRPVRVGGFSGTTPYVPNVTQLLVTDSGTAVWTLVQRYDDPARPEWATLYAGDGDGEARELDRVEPAALLTDVALSADGRTVTWRNGGVQRSAPLGG